VCASDPDSTPATTDTKEATMSTKKRKRSPQTAKIDCAATADANREMFGDDVEELIDLGILPGDIGDQ
jgi:hypothetical protein